MEMLAPSSGSFRGEVILPEMTYWAFVVEKLRASKMKRKICLRIAFGLRTKDALGERAFPNQRDEVKGSGLKCNSTGVKCAHRDEMQGLLTHQIGNVKDWYLVELRSRPVFYV